jgi:hypothetical protein
VIDYDDPDCVGIEALTRSRPSLYRQEVRLHLIRVNFKPFYLSAAERPLTLSSFPFPPPSSFVPSSPDAQLPTYIQTLALFLHKAQLFERHLLASLPLVSPTGQPTPAYRSLPPNLLASIQARLKRITAYLHASVLLFVLRDLEMLSERFVKRRDKELGSSH